MTTKPPRRKAHGRPDSLSRIVAQARAMLPQVDESTWESIERQLREQHGGGSVYIKRSPADCKALLLGEALRKGLSLPEAFRVAGVSRATGYRLLRRATRR